MTREELLERNRRLQAEAIKQKLASQNNRRVTELLTYWANWRQANGN